MAQKTQSQPLVARLLAARREVQRLNKEMEEQTGVTGTRALVLHALLSHDSVSQTRLVELTGVDRSTLADVVRRLLATGHITRRRSKSDSRAYVVRLTEQGRLAAQRINLTL